MIIQKQQYTNLHNDLQGTVPEYQEKFTLRKLMRTQNMGTILILVFLFAACSLTTESFFKFNNIMNITRQVSMVGIMACGVTFVIISGSLDLSIGQIYMLTSIVACKLTHVNIFLAILLPIVVGAMCGLLNGVLVGYFRLHPLITTMGTQSVFLALGYALSEGHPIRAAENEFFRQIGQGNIFGRIPVPSLIFAFIIAFTWFLLKKTTYGRKVYLVGGNPEAARFSGFSFVKVTMINYVFAGMLAGLSGIVVCSRMMSGVPSMGTGYEFQVMTAVILGGVSFSGGKGSIFGTLIGMLIVGVLNNSYIQWGISSSVQYFFQGVIFIIAVVLDTMHERKLGLVS